MQDPDLLAAFQDPEIMAALQDGKQPCHDSFDIYFKLFIRLSPFKLPSYLFFCLIEALVLDMCIHYLKLYCVLMRAVMKNPANLAKHQGNPKVAPVIAKMFSKMSGGAADAGAEA